MQGTRRSNFLTFLTLGISSFVICLGWVSTCWAAPLASSAETGFREAAGLYRQGQWQLAAEAFAACTKSASDAEQHVAARFYLGESLMQLGDYASARRQYRAVLEQTDQSPYASRALFRAGEAAWLDGDPADAQALLQKFARTHPHNALAAYAFTYLGDMALSAGAYQRSIGDYRTVVDSYAHTPQAAVARLGLAKALFAAGRTREVALALGRLVEEDDRTIAAEALLLQARAEYGLGQYNKALTTFRKLYDGFPGKTPGEKPGKQLAMQARLAGGWSLWKLGRFEEIPDEIAPLADTSRWAVDHRYLLGMCAYGDHDWQAAIERLTLAAERAESHPSRDAIVFYLAESHFRVGHLDKARRWYRQLSEQRPHSKWTDDALWGLARIAREEHDREQLQATITELRRQFPASWYLQRFEQASLDRADLLVASEEEKLLDEAVGLERDGRYDAALAAYRQLLQQYPVGRTRAETLRRAARLHHQLAQYATASTLYQKFLAEYPRNTHTAEAIAALARIEDRLGNRKAAADWFRKVHAKFPQSAQALEAAYWLALYDADEGDSAQALHFVDWILDEPSSSDDNRQRKLWEQALLLKCQLEASAGRWQVLKELLVRLRGQLKPGPNEARAKFWLAEAEFRTGHYDEARTALEQLLPATAGLDEPWVAMVPLRQAQLRLRRQQWTEMLKLTDLLDKEYPEFELKYEVDYLRGRAHAGRGEMTLARQAYDRVLKNPAAKDTETAAMAQWMIGETFFHQRDYPRARQAFLKVIDEQSPSEWQARAALQAGKCWELENHWDEARALYATALERWQGSQAEEQLRARLKWADTQTTQRR